MTYNEEQARANYEDPEQRAAYRRGFMNMQLAPTLDIYLALQASEAVPLELLNQDAVRKYGLKKEAA